MIFWKVVPFTYLVAIWPQTLHEWLHVLNRFNILFDTSKFKKCCFPQDEESGYMPWCGPDGNSQGQVSLHLRPLPRPSSWHPRPPWWSCLPRRERGSCTYRAVKMCNRAQLQNHSRVFNLQVVSARSYQCWWGSHATLRTCLGVSDPVALRVQLNLLQTLGGGHLGVGLSCHGGGCQNHVSVSNQSLQSQLLSHTL